MRNFPVPDPSGRALPEPTLGERMRAHEAVTRTVLPRQTFTVVRLDGSRFSQYTKGLVKPFDDRFATDMDTVALTLAAEYPGTHLVYVASDEISLVTSDTATPTTEPHLGGVVPKIVSLTAARATATFNAARADLHTNTPVGSLPLFDARAFTLPTPAKVSAYLAWRVGDTRRNALAMLCDHHLGKKATRGKDTTDRVTMLAEKGVSWSDTDPRHAFGRLVVPAWQQAEVTFTRRDTGQVHTATATRKQWVVQAAPERVTADVLGDLLAGAYVSTAPDGQAAAHTRRSSTSG